MKQAIKQYFQFSRRERNGVFILLFVLLALMVVNAVLPSILNVYAEHPLFAENKRKLQQLENKNKPSVTFTGSLPLKPFNPNTASKDSLLQCGINEKLAQQILNYRSKGGRFNVKTDFAKLYYLTDSAYRVIAPFLLLPDKYTKTEPQKQKIVELNSADTAQLITVKGIGSYYALQIIKYRQQLGGFYTIEQLGEAININAPTLQEKQQRLAEIKKQLRIDTGYIEKIDINTAIQKQLSHHPYISYGQAKKILSLRKKKNIPNWETLISEGVFTENEKSLLVHYIRF